MNSFDFKFEIPHKEFAKGDSKSIKIRDKRIKKATKKFNKEVENLKKKNKEWYYEGV